MTVIAMTQEMGSLAKDVAEQVALDLGLEVMRHEVADNVSTRMHVPTSLIHRLREGKAGTIERLRADKVGLAVYMTEEVLEVAARGNVVLRGGVPPACCARYRRRSVRVTRPFAQRAAWLQERGHRRTRLRRDEIRRRTGRMRPA